MNQPSSRIIVLSMLLLGCGPNIRAFTIQSSNDYAQAWLTIESSGNEVRDYFELAQQAQSICNAMNGRSVVLHGRGNNGERRGYYTIAFMCREK